jgi:hypothetical protein
MEQHQQQEQARNAAPIHQQEEASRNGADLMAIDSGKK